MKTGMSMFLARMMAAAALTALSAGAAYSQESAGTQAPADTAPMASKPGTPPERFEEAFPQMISEEVVQGDLPAPGPLIESWSLGAAGDLVRFIEGIGAEGLDPADYDLEALRVAMRSGPSEELDKLASKNFVWLVEDLRDGRTPMEAREQWFIVDPDRDRYRTSDLLKQAASSGDVSGVLGGLNPVHADYAMLREALARTPASDKAKRKLIRANMDRWRWLARDLGTIHLITNIPEFQLRLRAGEKTFTYKTIVGKPGRTATPQLAEAVSGVVFNPTWTVPQSIVKGEGLGERVLANPGWARAKGYKATRGANGYISVVQQPGPTNSLGRMKLEMPNPHAIFFHDTPARELFNQANRALSHGCIRTERALELAMTVAILGKAATKEEAVEIATSGEYTKVAINREIPAYITYFTMGSDVDGKLTTFSDIYERDAPVLASLDKPRKANRATTSDDEVIVIEDDPRAQG
ncbi:MAG: L,D-transpeptidase family protein [Erythrobacter sp.]|jgi:murein L,D-transpeptidase YcbB/YkuD|nr:L,D-transpeptidase family protein [Erythrobacter sp.]